MHRGIGFYREQFEHRDGTGPANPLQIIAQKIHNHQIFGAVFWICGKKITVCLICHGAAHLRLGAIHRSALYRAF